MQGAGKRASRPSLAPEGAGSGVARAWLGPRLAAHRPAFFPLNHGVLAAAGEQAARVYVLEPLLSGHRLHHVSAFGGVAPEGLESIRAAGWERVHGQSVW